MKRQKKFKRSITDKKLYIYLVAFTLIGAGLLLFARAAVSTTSIETESGTVVSPARKLTNSDVTASGSSFIEFGTTSTSTGQGLRVSGNRLTKDGKTYIPKGFNSIGILMPDNCPRPKGDPTNAAKYMNQDMFNAMKNTWKTDSIRFQVSQTGLDPQSELKSGQSAYIQKIRNAVQLAQNNGHTVILSMQDQVYSCGRAHKLPSSETVRAWQVLAPIFKDNQNVMYELFNEPQNQTSDADWNQWRNGGNSLIQNYSEYGGYLYDVVGHQRLVDVIRASGAQNILIANGANKSGKFNGFWQSATKNYFLTDTLATPQIAYAIHPYYFHTSSNASLSSDRSNWESRWGYLNDPARVPADRQPPILATEWNTSGVTPCYTSVFNRAPEFLNYLKNDYIGVYAQAIDIQASGNRSIVLDVPGWRPTQFRAGVLPCESNTDAGEVLIQFYSSFSN